MENKRTILSVLFILVVIGTVVSSADAHVKRRYDPSHKPAWRIVPHKHEADSQVQADTKTFNPVQGAAWLVGGIYEAFEGTLKAVFTAPKNTNETQEKATHQRPAAHNRTGFLFGFPGRK
ncbi:MAG: hypothetical protein ACYTEN_07150 [Planctomycetota bacterium]|jgi:hypothetical protein